MQDFFNIIYFIAQKMFFINILEGPCLDQISKVKEAIFNEEAKNKSRGIQLIGPTC